MKIEESDSYINIYIENYMYLLVEVVCFRTEMSYFDDFWWFRFHPFTYLKLYKTDQKIRHLYKDPSIQTTLQDFKKLIYMFMVL